MHNWYIEVREKTESIFQSIVKHNFIKELLEGTLDKSIFQFYIHQDSYYLSEYKKSLATLAIRLTDQADSQFFLEAATGIINVEMALHDTFVDKVNSQPELSPTCELYNSYLSRVVNNNDVAIGLAAILPCFTIYKEVGDYILAHQTGKESNQYQSWINTYGGEEFAKSVEQAIQITNKCAENANESELKQMEAAFIKASKLEWMFWDSAYQKETWKV